MSDIAAAAADLSNLAGANWFAKERITPRPTYKQNNHDRRKLRSYDDIQAALYSRFQGADDGCVSV